MIKRAFAFALLVAWMPLYAIPMNNPLGARTTTDTLYSADSLNRPSDSLTAKAQGVRKLKAVRRDYDFRQQIGQIGRAHV
jgi:hypothetical protein